jgi:small subunit ribosomal protein S24e
LRTISKLPSTDWKLESKLYHAMDIRGLTNFKFYHCLGNPYMSKNSSRGILSVEIVVLSDRDNRLMKRKELKLILKNASSGLKTRETIELVAKKQDVDIEKIIPIAVGSSKGNVDLNATFHIYDEKSLVNKIPRFRKLRLLDRSERKKILEEEKASKIKAKQASAEKKGKKQK